MAQLYDFPYLCYQHIASGELGGVLPEVTPTSLEQATMRLVRLIGKFAKSGRLDQLLEINEDGRITAEERPLHTRSRVELRDITSTYLELDCATQKESAQGGTGRD